MLTLIRNATVFAPEPLGRRDVLLAGDRIAAVGEDLDLAGAAVTVLDAAGRRLVPGFIDPLTHPCGGGGEGGFGNRTGEVPAEAFLRAGVTSPVGALGTDSIARTPEVLYGSVMGLRAAGLDAFMYTGAYRLPPPTLTGDVARDLVLVAPVIGVGEVAIADHRGSQPTVEELRRLAADVALGGTLSDKGGTVFVHVGEGAEGLGLIEAVLAGSELDPGLFLPTHVNRRLGLLEEAAYFTRNGGYADITVSTTPELVAAGDVPALAAYQAALDAGADPARLSFSSDAGGSLPLYVDGRLAGLEAATPAVLPALLGEAAAQDDALFAGVLAGLTANPARALGLRGIGRVETGARANLLLLDAEHRQPTHVFCRGRALLDPDTPPDTHNDSEE